MQRATDGDEIPRSPLTTITTWLGLVILFVACYGSALFQGGQFAFRDATHFYYPLHERVQQEWHAGRLPLWDPGENGGAPILGNPVAAVLYPGKIIFAALPYPWAARLYIVAHAALAIGAMWLLLRSWEVSRVGSAIGAFSYAFGAPVLFQYCNIVFLVGAAWLPLGFRAADRWLRLGRRWGVIELAIVLAMQSLGGDLESAYLLGVCSGAYAIALGLRSVGFVRAWPWWAGVLILIVSWAIAARALGSRLEFLRSGPGQAIVVILWVGALRILSFRRRRTLDRKPLGSMLFGLMTAAVLGSAISAVQLVPVGENLAASARWDEENRPATEVFSLAPYRLVEAAWPNPFGSMLTADRFWLSALPLGGTRNVWVPSLYLGLLPLVLAFGAIGFRGGPEWRGWLSAVAILGFAASCGKFLEPSSWRGESTTVGSLYQLMATVLPGFGGFRYPSKLLVFVSLAISGLAGLGWDRALAGRGRRRASTLAILILVLSLVGLGLVVSNRSSIARFWMRSEPGQGSIFGPFDLDGAFLGLFLSLTHAAILSTAAIGLIIASRRRPAIAGPLAILIVAVDLAIANAGLVFTIPQADFDREPEAIRIFREADRGQPETEGPYRIQRMPQWAPPLDPSRSARFSPPRQLVNWERDTLKPNFGLVEGVAFTSASVSGLEHEDLGRFFRPYARKIDARTASAIGADPSQDVILYPRKGFDLWGTRYFLLPIRPEWQTAHRGILSFLDRTEVVYPRPGSTVFRALPDFQIRRNLAALPRAWTVHDAMLIPPPNRENRRDFSQKIIQLLARGESPGAGAGADPRRTAIVETHEPKGILPFLSRSEAELDEAPRITKYESDRVEISVILRTPGIVVLSDLFDPGWRLSIDDKPAEILKTNALMRGAAVAKGDHRLVFVYAPRSLRVGAAISVVGFIAFAAACFWAWRKAKFDRGSLDRSSEVVS